MEKKLKILLIISLIAILEILYLAQNIQPKQTDIANITEEQLNKNIKVIAQIKSVRDFPESHFQILSLEDKTGKIQATANSPTALDLSNNKSQEYEIMGKITEYNNTLQISINKIAYLS